MREKKTSKVPKEGVLILKAKGFSLKEIADFYGVSYQAIQQHIAKDPDSDLKITRHKKYHEHKAEIFRYYQHLILSYITEDKLKKANIDQLTRAFGIMYDKERLETGKSTQNIAGLTAIVEKIEKMDDGKIK